MAEMDKKYLHFFSNPEGPRLLEHLHDEQKFLKETIEIKSLNYLFDSFDVAKLDHVEKDYKPHRKSLRIFGYSGHASEDSLSLAEDKLPNSVVLNDLSTCPDLRLVILNGCCTYKLAHNILEKLSQVKFIIATNCHVKDKKANKFFQSFVEHFFKQNEPIEEAFRKACIDIVVRENTVEEGDYRGPRHYTDFEGNEYVFLKHKDNDLRINNWRVQQLLIDENYIEPPDKDDYRVITFYPESEFNTNLSHALKNTRNKINEEEGFFFQAPQIIHPRYQPLYYSDDINKHALCIFFLNEELYNSISRQKNNWKELFAGTKSDVIWINYSMLEYQEKDIKSLLQELRPSFRLEAFLDKNALKDENIDKMRETKINLVSTALEFLIKDKKGSRDKKRTYEAKALRFDLRNQRSKISSLSRNIDFIFAQGDEDYISQKLLMKWLEEVKGNKLINSIDLSSSESVEEIWDKFWPDGETPNPESRAVQLFNTMDRCYFITGISEAEPEKKKIFNEFMREIQKSRKSEQYNSKVYFFISLLGNDTDIEPLTQKMKDFVVVLDYPRLTKAHVRDWYTEHISTNDLKKIIDLPFLESAKPFSFTNLFKIVCKKLEIHETPFYKNLTKQ